MRSARPSSRSSAASSRRYRSTCTSGTRPGSSCTRSKVGLVTRTSRGTPSPRAIARARNVLPAPSSPSSRIKSPAQHCGQAVGRAAGCRRECSGSTISSARSRPWRAFIPRRPGSWPDRAASRISRQGGGPGAHGCAPPSRRGRDAQAGPTLDQPLHAARPARPAATARAASAEIRLAQHQPRPVRRALLPPVPERLREDAHGVHARGRRAIRGGAAARPGGHRSCTR